MKIIKKLTAFTLVELIIVITILAILATIAFVSFQNYVKDARDSNRLSTIKNIENGLNAFQITTGNYPEPDNKSTIFLSGTKVSYQWEIGTNVTNLIKLSKIPKDPQNNLPYYYATSDVGKGYKMLSYLENTQASITNQTYAALNTPIVKWIWPAILTDSENNIIKSDVDLFATQSWTLYKVLIDNTIQSSGSGIDIGWWFQMMAVKWWDFSAPKSCPDGFIPVPGNQEFLQPWFCVAKYEMALERDLLLWEISAWSNTWSGSMNSQSLSNIWIDGKIVSKPGKYPISNTTPIQAISACEQISGHLITNNEWMTIARNIEANNDNWNSWIVGSWGIFRWIVNESNTSIKTLWCASWDSSWLWINLLIKSALVFDTTKWWTNKTTDCDSKRQLKLNNWEVIWDLSWNIDELVNAGNTINGFGYDKKIKNICETISGWLWLSYTYNAVNDVFSECIFSNGSSYSNMWPKIKWLNRSNWIGWIYDWFWTVITRWWWAWLWGHAWIYHLYSNRGTNTKEGFRCAK